MPKFSIIIPTYNHLHDCLIPCVQSIIKYTDLFDTEVIIVSNGSGDGTGAYVRGLGEPFKLIEYREALGFTKAVNKGAAAATGEFLVILNNDLILLENFKSQWLQILLYPFKDSDVAITGAAKNYHVPTRHDFLLFFCVMIRRSIFEELGGLDEVFNPGYGEDIDFCFKARNAGYRVLQVPNDLNLSELRKADEHVLQFPIYHKSSQTVHGVQGWTDIVERNERILQERYGSSKSLDIGNLLDTIPASEITPKIDSLMSTLPEDGILHAKLNDWTNLTLAKSGFIHGIFPGKENVGKLKRVMAPFFSMGASLETIKELVRAVGSKSLEYFGGTWEGGYGLQQDIDEISQFLYDIKDKKFKSYLEIGPAEGGVTRLICEIAQVGDVTHIDMGWGDMNHPYTYREGIENLKNTGKIEIFRGDSHSQQAKDFLQKRKFDMIFIDADHSYEGVLKDTELAMEHAEDGCLFVFHDHVAVPEVGRLYLEMVDGQFGNLTFEKEYISENEKTSKGISVFKYHDIYLQKDLKPKISIVIPTYNHLEDCLKPCLHSIGKYTTLDEVEIIIVANGCSDDTEYWVHSKKDLGFNIKLLSFPEPLGFIKACNAGIKEAKGEFVILLNNDTELLQQEKDTWLKMLSIPFMDEKVGITGPYKDWRFFWEKDKLVFREEYIVFYCAMIRKEVFDKVGLLDEDLGLGYEEDVDFAIRAKQAGYKIVQVPEDMKDELSVTKEFLETYSGRSTEFPMYHKDKVTFKDVKENKGKKTSILQKHGKVPEVSIIIPTFNHLEDLLWPCLKSIADNTDLENTEVIVVANGCTDQTREAVNSLGNPFKLYWIDEQVGFIKATNAGIKQAMGRYIVLLNNDTEIKANYWLNILKTALLGTNMGIAGPVKAFRDDVKRDYILFWCAMIKQEVFDKIGLLDEQFGIGYHEDVDFCMRAENAGFQLVETPNFPIFHKGGGTFAPLFGESEERLTKHANKLYNKHGSLPPGWFGYGDQYVYQKLVSSIPDKGTIAEIGVWQGLSLCTLADTIKEKNLKVIAIDTFQGSPWESYETEEDKGAIVPEGADIQEEFKKNILKFGIKGNVTIYPLSSLEAVKTIENNSLDFVFLDADHRYESVKADIIEWVGKVKNSGILAGHDFKWGESVRKAVFEIFGENNISFEENIWWVSGTTLQKAKWIDVSQARRGEMIITERPKVYDCFTFFNELDVLEIRLNELDSVVDYFVLCEAGETHQGQLKPFYFEENKERFAKFLPKIKHLVIDKFPEDCVTTWDREHYQREYIALGVEGAKVDDIVILSDADEIVSAETVREYKPEMGVAAVEMPLFYFKLDWKLEEKWYKPRIFTFSAAEGKTMQDFRGGHDYEYRTILENGGWHFSFIGDKESVKHKIQSYAHEEFNNDTFTNDKNIEEAIEQGRDVFKRDLHFHKVPIDNTYPQFVRDNIKYYEDKGLISKTKFYRDFIDWCISAAEAEASSINPDILKLEGMSNERIRHLFNNLLSYGNLNYLEVGCWRGATTSAALSNNKLSSVTIIDDFSEFSVPNEEQKEGFVHPKEEMKANLHKYGGNNTVTLFQKDFFKVDMSELPKVDVFFYDGNHSEEAQYKALRHALPALADKFIYIVDDYSWPIVHKPVQKSLQDLTGIGEIRCLYEKVLESELPPKDIWPDGWNHLFTNLIGKWRNGLYIGLFEKCIKEDVPGIGGESFDFTVRRDILPSKNKPKVYDCFSFFNELDLLEIRLNELDPYVDFFVISEMHATHSGIRKPLYFQENKERFKKFLDKIIYINPIDTETLDPWVREHYQRDYMKSHLNEYHKVKDTDIIIVSDLDEIPRGEKIKEYDGKGVKFFWQNQYSYYLNYNVGTSPIAPGTFSRITNMGYLRRNDLSFTGLRYLLLQESDGIKDGGWHFSWMGGASSIAKKLESWAHQEFNKPENKNVDRIENFIESGKEHLGRQGVGETTPVEIDDSFPKYIQEHQSDLLQKGLIKDLDKGRVAIIMPYHNDKMLTKSVSAIMGQTYKNWELYIIDDGSDQDKKAGNILARYPKVAILNLMKNGGPSHARNVAFEVIRNNKSFDYVAFCDSDDIWEPNYLASQLAVIGDSQIVYCSVNHQFENGDMAFPYGIPDPEEYPGREVMLQTPFIFISGVVMKVECLKVGNFDGRLDSIEDWDFWLRLDEAGYKFKKNDQKLLTYTVKEGMASKRTPDKYELLKSKHEMEPV